MVHKLCKAASIVFSPVTKAQQLQEFFQKQAAEHGLTLDEVMSPALRVDVHPT